MLDEPIPQIAFGPPDNKVFSRLHDWSRLIGQDCGGWSDFRILLDWMCWGLSLAHDEPHLSEEVNGRLYRQVDLTPMLETPHGYLGEYVAAGKSRGWNPTGFYPTPHNVVECMVRMLLHDTTQDGHDSRTLSVCDPCVGSGRMLLHASNLSLCLFGQDIDPLAVAMCKINGPCTPRGCRSPCQSPSWARSLSRRRLPYPCPIRRPRMSRSFAWTTGARDSCSTSNHLRSTAMPNGARRNVYLIRQDLTHLLGQYLVNAVVIAPGPGWAIKSLLRHIRNHHPAVIAQRSRLRVTRIGDNAPDLLDLPSADDPGDEATIVAIALREDASG